MKRFIGRNPSDSIVDAVVIETLKPRSALKRAHHQLLYDPPGDETTMIKVTPTGTGRLNAIVTRYPKKGIKKN